MSEQKKTPAQELVLPRLRSFLEAMGAIGDVEDFVRDNSSSLNSVENAFVVQAKRLFPGVDVEVHRRAAEYIHPKIHMRMDGIQALKTKKAGQSSIDNWTKAWESNVKKKLAELTGDGDYFYKYARVWNSMSTSGEKSKLLRNSLLMAAVSDFEVLVSGLVRAFLTLKPEILRSAEAKYSFSDLEPFATVDEFRLHCVENMADSLLRGGFDDWMERFDSKRKVKVEGVTENAAALVEIFQRRHLLVHNGGVVNRFYLSKVPSADAPSEGQVLGVSRTYLNQSLDELTVAGIKLSFSLLRKIGSSPEDLEEADHQIYHLSLDYLTAESWQVAYRLCDWHLGFVQASSTRLVAIVNRWVAQKEIDGLESIREEVEAWDVATLAGIYKLAKHALLDENEEAYSLAKALIASDEIDRDDWRDWPMLRSVRSYEADNVRE